MNHTLKDVTEAGYKVAEERDIKSIGAELKKAYERVLSEPEKPELEETK